MPVLLVLVLATPAGIAYGVRLWRQQLASAKTYPTTPPGAPDEGRSGAGDPYFSDYGSSGYDAVKYAISMDWDVDTETLQATTTITAKATQPLRSFYVDLALRTRAVRVNGRPAQFEHSGFQDLKIIPASTIAAGADFTVVVEYSGTPGMIKRGDVAPWLKTGSEWTAAGEPESSAWWFPANDHPSDPALMDVTVRVPAGLEVVSVGRLESADSGTEADFDTWHWVSRQPMATYLNFVTIGQYQLQQGVVDGRPYVYAVSEQLSEAERSKAFAALQQSGQIVGDLEAMYGDYPFTELGGVVPAHQLRFAGLETQTRPVYERGAILNHGFAPEVITHELAHMWFGDNVTVRQWNDIFTSEAYASWSQWGRAERAGGRRANDELNRLYDRAKERDDFWRVTMIDPGPDKLFSTVYARGPMALQALRNVIGDKAFFALAREWSQNPGSRSVEEWMVKAQAKTSVDLVPFFQAWIIGSTAPARTAANGFR
ncbi:MAG: Membrane alanine aminopeptidase N [uncultured Propionibacteriaceae bacterium]|uniref:Aminopeptidase N n=1 Tax=uncultured Propionibacteriaceae bacterium TaxID=257457 RepID=A0A6J4NWK6_9ACTN|nr:MAG: Membrane alanine aminopeptidase N [uncultured Propionibacteriaceae bacterium]